MRERRLAASFAALLTISTLVGVVALPTTAHATDLDAVNFDVQAFATVPNAIAITTRASDPRLYVADRTGKVRIVNTDGSLVATPVVTVTVSTSSERGLLGLAFSLDGNELYIFYNIADGTIKVVEYTMNVDVGTAPRELLSIAHPAGNHNGGQLNVGSDGMLYISTGDGGGSGDPTGNGQNKTVLLGKVLRIDPTPGESLPYTIPPDNPFVGDGGGVREEIWMYGLRNPWRWSFDKANGDMYIADVGQNAYEEVDYAPADVGGANWGWDLREGNHDFEGGPLPGDIEGPLFERAHDDGYCAIIGGYVYRGSAIPALQGAYVYGDLCRSTLSAVEPSGATVADERDFTNGISSPVTFGQDINGELYVANLTGVISKLVPPTPLTISIGDESMLEGDARTRSMSFPVTLSRPAATTQTVQYTVTPVSPTTGGLKALPGVDFKTKSGTLTFTAKNGKTTITKSISVSVFGDITDGEGNETFEVTLSNPSSGLELGRAVGTGTILDDENDGALGVSVGIGGGTIVESRTGQQRITIPVTMSDRASGEVKVDYTIAPGSAIFGLKKASGGDYGGKITGTLIFKNGTAIVRQVGTTIWPGNGFEGAESYTITLSNLAGAPATLTEENATVTILSN